MENDFFLWKNTNLPVNDFEKIENTRYIQQIFNKTNQKLLFGCSKTL